MGRTCGEDMWGGHVGDMCCSWGGLGSGEDMWVLCSEFCSVFEDMRCKVCVHDVTTKNSCCIAHTPRTLPQNPFVYRIPTISPAGS